MRDCRFRELVEVIICKFPSSLLLTASLILGCLENDDLENDDLENDDIENHVLENDDLENQLDK